MNILLLAHSLLRYIILALCIIVIYQSFIGFSQKKNFSIQNNKMSLALLISTHTMLLIGLIQYFTGANGFNLIKLNGMAVVMKDATSRFFAVEHITVMIIATILIQIGRSMTKKLIPDVQKHKSLFWYTLIALILILSRIPWPFMQMGQGRGWL
jgi:hypothetical protein